MIVKGRCEVHWTKSCASFAERELIAGPRSESASDTIPFADIVRLRKICLQAQRPGAIL